MDKIEVGEYVISKNRLVLGEVIEIKNNTELIIKTLLQDGFRHKIPIAINNIRKHSKNKIELLEVGDIVELADALGTEVIYIWDNEMLEAVKQDIKEGEFLKSILTHEQFESVKYNFEEEN